MFMTDKPSVILVNIKRVKDWFVATSADLPGLHVSDPDMSLVVRELPDVIKAIFKVKYDVVVDVVEAATESKDVFPLRYTTKPTKQAA